MLAPSKKFCPVCGRDLDIFLRRQASVLIRRVERVQGPFLVIVYRLQLLPRDTEIVCSEETVPQARQTK